MAKSNIQRLLNKAYVIEINYIYRALDKCYEFAHQREIVTKRKVPMKIVKKTFKDSFDTVLFIKSTFQDAVILNLIDRENDTIHENINEVEFLTLLQKEIL